MHASRDRINRCTTATELASSTAPFASPPTIGEPKSSRASSVVQHLMRQLQDKCALLRRIRPSDWRRLTKITRKFLGLNRSPKGKGYEQFLSDEDKRWIEEYVARQAPLSPVSGVPYYY